MAIKSKNPTGVISVGTSDTVLFTPTDKVGIEAFNLHNTTATEIVVSVYISSDNTSVNGDRVDQVTVYANSETDVNSVIGQALLAPSRIVCVADSTGVNSQITYTQFTGDDV